MMREKRIDIIHLSETKISDKFSLNCPGYEVYRRNQNYKGSSVARASKSWITSLFPFNSSFKVLRLITT